MKQILGLMLVTCWFVISIQAEAGPRVGNGGGTWVCFEHQLGIRRWVTLIDLFEAEYEFNLQLENTPPREPWAVLSEKLTRVQREIPALAEQLTLGSEELRKLIRWVPRSSELTNIDDGMIRVRPSPSSCLNGTLFYAQAANFTDDGRLLIADDIWSDPAFSDLDRAALLMHEIVYKALREKKGDQNSSRARRIVGLLFSDLSSAEVNQEIAQILSGEPLPEPEPPLPDHEPVCEATVSFYSSMEGLTSIVLEKKNGKLEARLGSFHFIAEIRDQVPIYLQIYDLASGARAIVTEDTARAVYLKHGRVSALLESTKDKSVALLHCK